MKTRKRIRRVRQDGTIQAFGKTWKKPEYVGKMVRVFYLIGLDTVGIIELKGVKS